MYVAGASSPTTTRPPQQPSTFDQRLQLARNQLPPGGPPEVLQPDTPDEPESRTLLGDDNRDGVIKHEVKRGENLTTIARQYTETREQADRLVWSIVATDPQFAIDRQDPHGLRIGQTITIYDPARAQMARDMMTVAETGGMTGVRAIAYTEILYATQHEATPADQLAEIVRDLKARRPGDAAFAEAINEAGRQALDYWDGVGRTHTVFDPLIQAANQRDWGRVEQIALEQFETLAETHPTVEAIEAHKGIILRYGPQTAEFQTAVDNAARTFLVDRPQQAADAIRQAYEEGGAEAGAAKLREVTDPLKTDGLMVALISQKADATIDAITSDWVNTLQNFWTDTSDSRVHDLWGIFSDLSAFADSLRRSPDGLSTFNEMAARMSEAPWIPDVLEDADLAGSGTFLPLEIARQLDQRGETELAKEVVDATLQGHEDLEDLVRERVTTFGNHSVLVTKPEENFAPLLTDTQVEQANQAWLEQPPDFVRQLDTDLREVDRVGYQYLRSLEGLEHYKDELKDLDPSGSMGQQTAQLETDKQLEFALTSTKSPGIEALRLLNEENTASGQLYDPLTLVTQVDEGLAVLADAPSPAARAAVFATLGLGPGFLALSRVKFGKAADFRVAGLLPEQWIRDMVLRTAASDQWLDNPGHDLLVKSVVNDVAIGIMSVGYNTTLGRRNPDVYRIPGQAVAARLTMPWLVNAGEAVIRELEAEGVLPKPKMGPDGRPQYDNIFEWMAYQAPRTANVAFGVGVPLAAASGYRALAASAPGLAPGETASFRQAFRGRSPGEILRTGWPEAWRTGKLSVGVLTAQYLIAEAFFANTANPEGLPPLENSAQDGPWGKGSMAVGLIGFALSFGASTSWAGPIGWLLTVIATAGMAVTMGIDKARFTSQLEDPTEQYLIAAGLDPEIAKHLANHDQDGRSLAPLLVQMADYLGITPQRLLQWFNQQDPEWLEDFVPNHLHRIRPGEDGIYPLFTAAEAFYLGIGDVVGYAAETGHPMPRA